MKSKGVSLLISTLLFGEFQFVAAQGPVASTDIVQPSTTSVIPPPVTSSSVDPPPPVTTSSSSPVLPSSSAPPPAPSSSPTSSLPQPPSTSSLAPPPAPSSSDNQPQQSSQQVAPSAISSSTIPTLSVSSTTSATSTAPTGTSSSAANSSDASDQSSKIGIIVGCVVAIVLMFFAAFCIFWYKKRQQEKETLIDFKSDPTAGQQYASIAGPRTSSYGFLRNDNNNNYSSSSATLDATAEPHQSHPSHTQSWSSRFSSFPAFFVPSNTTPSAQEQGDVQFPVASSDSSALKIIQVGGMAAAVNHTPQQDSLIPSPPPSDDPVIVLEPLAPNNPTYTELSSQFSFWNASLVSIHSILVPDSILSAFQEREQTDLAEWGSSFLFHHASRCCDIGIDGKKTPCNDEACGICTVLKYGFDIETPVTRGVGSGKFGKGLYFSMTARSTALLSSGTAGASSSSPASFITPPRASVVRTSSPLNPDPAASTAARSRVLKSVLVCEVLLGNAYSPVSANEDPAFALGEGFHSVWGKPDQVEGLPADEFVVYRNDQALAVYLCSYE